MKLYHGDCLQVMKDISDASVDMVLCDLPYGITQNQWDATIPLDKMWTEIYRISKNNCAILLFSMGAFSAKLILSNEKYYRYTIIWEKTRPGGFLNAKRMPLQAHEDILVFYKKLPVYNPQYSKGTPYTTNFSHSGESDNYGKFERVGRTLINDGIRFPRSVVKFSNNNHNSLHPTQKPVALLEYLIKTYTNEGDTVLDFTMGSGSTGVACANTGRNFIGIELDEKYFNIAKDRVNQALEVEKSV